METQKSNTRVRMRRLEETKIEKEAVERSSLSENQGISTKERRDAGRRNVKGVGKKLNVQEASSQDGHGDGELLAPPCLSQFLLLQTRSKGYRLGQDSVDDGADNASSAVARSKRGNGVRRCRSRGGCRGGCSGGGARRT